MMIYRVGSDLNLIADNLELLTTHFLETVEMRATEENIELQRQTRNLSSTVARLTLILVSLAVALVGLTLTLVM